MRGEFGCAKLTDSLSLPPPLQVQLTDKVPFLLEKKLRELGAEFSNGDPWGAYAVADGKLVTGQNPQSTVACAKLALTLL